MCSTMICFILFPACAQTKIEYKSPTGYDLTQPEEFFLPDILHEISGIAFEEDKSDEIYAVEDETGNLYYFNPENDKLQKTKFGKKGDYEDLAVINNYVAVLRSDGKLFTFPLAEINQKKIKAVKEWKNLIPKEEYESLAAKDSLLYVLCKECSIDKKTHKTSGYIFKLSKGGKLTPIGNFIIDGKQINAFFSLKNKDFRPSALTKNKLTNEWYILSSINKMLVVTDENWQVTSVYPLNPGIFNQPEGIAFDNKGNLYISNEGGNKTKKGTLLKFKLNP